MTAAALVNEHRLAAGTVLPPEVADYVASGSFDETTTREAESAWSGYRFAPRVLRDVSVVDTTVELLGSRFALPVAAAPSAFHGLAHADGECASRAAFDGARALFVASMRSSLPLAEIAAAGHHPWWYQTFATREPGPMLDLVAQVGQLGARAVVLTADTPIVGPKPRIAGRRIRVPDAQFFSNVAPSPGADQADFPALEESPAATFATVARIRDLAGLPVVVKGVLRPDDARRAVDAGAAAIVVSSHGGRQCARTISTAEALPEIVRAVGGQVPVLVDGGVRSGVDVVCALALGASMVLIGRPVLWALAAGGRPAVANLIGALHREIEQMMALLGAREVSELTADLVRGVAHPPSASRSSVERDGGTVPSNHPEEVNT